MLILWGFKAKIHGVKQRPQLVVSFLTDIGYTIWQVMYMNGVQIGMMRITTTLHHLKIQKGQNQAQRGDEYYEVGLGIILQATLHVACSYLLATVTIRLIDPKALVFDVFLMLSDLVD